VQPPYDCQRLVCDNGYPRAVPDDSDAPHRPCAQGWCSDGQAYETPEPDGAACQVGEGSGSCLGGQCIVVCDPAHPGVVCDDGNPCTVDACDVTLANCLHEQLDGVPAPGTEQIVGDCQSTLCVAGTKVTAADDSDVPDDGNPCTLHSCTDGVPGQSLAPLGTSCGNGLECNDSGLCVGCVADWECPYNGTYCQDPDCEGGVCGVANKGVNIEVPGQNPGPCLKVVCDGNGWPITVNANDGGPCSDGSLCNGDDTCLGGNCSSHTGDPCAANVGDPDGDCAESCQEGTGLCADPDPNGSACDDGIACNGTDQCMSGACSVHGAECGGAGGTGASGGSGGVGGSGGSGGEGNSGGVGGVGGSGAGGLADAGA
jgi:uncharacterized membrane protein YgcG